MNLLGELAALGTSLCFSLTSTFFTLAGRQVGSVMVNRIRLLLAVGFLMLIHWVLLGQPLPLGVGPERWFWLGLSGIIGLVLGDAFLFQAFVMIGPQPSMLMMSLTPIISGLAAWAFLGETLNGRQLLAVTLTVAGVILVIVERSGTPKMTAYLFAPDQLFYLPRTHRLASDRRNITGTYWRDVVGAWLA